MKVTTWNDGSYNVFGSGYGVRISKLDRDKFFDVTWESVSIHIGQFGNSVEIPLYDTFWENCLELRSIKIGKYLIDNGLNKWESNNPHKLLLLPQDSNQFILMISNPKKLETWANGSSFTYDGCVKFGTMIYFGKVGSIEITRQQYQLLLKRFDNMIISIGTSRNKAQTDSLGYWLQEHITKTAIASYVGKILIEEGYAEKIEGSMIKFNNIKQMSGRGSNVMDEDKIIELIKAKFDEKGNPSKIPLMKANKFLNATMKDEGIYVDNLSTYPFLPWDVFIETVKLIIRKDGKALKGDAMNSRLGSDNLPLDSIEGYIACSIYGKKINESVFRRISSIAGILIWANICRNKPGCLILNDKFEKTNNN
ncbi:hypothetical protein [Clostridium sp. ATCC 25772]|uniref:hypothetical protein n=1 Tax=Clostridium sp. ATCC 25772 TaxID=1676991 RepID=UPI000785493A|nr:hypothetical protein [Clostridium sp. ATCC 25772]